MEQLSTIYDDDDCYYCTIYDDDYYYCCCCCGVGSPDAWWTKRYVARFGNFPVSVHDRNPPRRVVRVSKIMME